MKIDKRFEKLDSTGYAMTLRLPLALYDEALVVADGRPMSMWIRKLIETAPMEIEPHDEPPGPIRARELLLPPALHRKAMRLAHGNMTGWLRALVFRAVQESKNQD